MEKVACGVQISISLKRGNIGLQMTAVIQATSHVVRLSVALLPVLPKVTVSSNFGHNIGCGIAAVGTCTYYYHSQ